MLTVGGLAAGMAHEINNPLAGIMQSVQVIQNRLLGTVKRNEETAAECGIELEKLRMYMEKRNIPAMLGAIVESGGRASRIVRNMLDFSRKSDQQLTPRPLAELIDKTVELAGNDYDLRKHYDFRLIEIERVYAPDMPLTPCIPGMLQQVLLNILKNGAQAMAEKTYTDDKPKFRLVLSHDEEYAEIRVEDNGPGMDEATSRHLFDPFFTTKEVGKGTGLGLSVSYFIIAENHGGTLDVEAQPGKGSTFIIRLPLGGTDASRSGD